MSFDQDQRFRNKVGFKLDIFPVDVGITIVEKNNRRGKILVRQHILDGAIWLIERPLFD